MSGVGRGKPAWLLEQERAEAAAQLQLQQQQQEEGLVL